MLVAFSTSDGAFVDKNIMELCEYSIWDINPDDAHFVTKVKVTEDSLFKHEKTQRRAEALTMCSIVCASEISGPAAARLISHGIHPMKTDKTTSVEGLIKRLQQVLKLNPPPWMQKAQWKQKLPAYS